MYGFPDSMTASVVKRGASKMSRVGRGERLSDAETFYFIFLVFFEFFASIFRGIARIYRAVARFARKRAKLRDRKARAKRAKAKLGKK
jgi:hypothetical protein